MGANDKTDTARLWAGQDADTERLDLTVCPGCGRQVSGVRYCPDCGHAIGLPTVSPPLTPRTATFPAVPVAPPSFAGRTAGAHGAQPASPSRSTGPRTVALAAVGALGLVIVAIAAIVLITGSSSTQPPRQSYRAKLAAAFAPVLAANRALSSSLQSMDGSKTTVAAAKTATVQAQSAATATTGALAVITVPSSEQTLSQQAQQALAQERGYLTAVSATLSSPTGDESAQVRALATNTQAALVPLGVISADAPSSVGGTDNLISWAAGAAGASKRAAQNAQQKAIQRAAQQASHTTTVVQTPPPAQGAAFVTPSGSPVPGSWNGDSASIASGVGTPYAWNGGQACDQNIFAGDSTPCSFANNIFMVAAAAGHYAGLLPGTITALNPADGTSYPVTCTEYTATDGTDSMQCVTSAGAGTAFPVWAANVYYG